MRKWLLLGSIVWMVGMMFSCGGAPSICDEEKPCPGGKNCVEGICVCPDIKTDCKGTCVLLGTDSKNCGECGVVCGKGKSCVSGKCTCEGGLKDCGACVDTNANVDHCGGCNKKCKQGEVCTDGACKTSCPDGQKACSGSCVNLQSSSLHCGGCGKACSKGQNCVSGKCECPPGTRKCGSECVDVKTSSKHCGECDKACASGQRCADAKCSTSCSKRNPDACQGGCYNFQSSNQHCGKCGNACSGGMLCSSGVCQCPSGRKDCNGKCIDVRISRTHCGACGNSCPSGNVCADGICQTSCPKSTEKICFGGCIDVKTHPENCGECGKACRAGEVCKDGLCGCPKGQTGCDKQCVDTKLNVNHCGACNNICPSGEKCAAGKCEKSCPPSTPTDCGGSCVDTKTSVKNCGKCGIVCVQGQTCNSGKCECPKGLSLCDGLCVDLFKDPLNCGKCANKCPARNKCVKTKDKNGDDIGQCQLDCSDETLNTQCENQCVNVNTDIRHCGQCKNVCGGLKGCAGGKCVCPTTPVKLDDCGSGCVNLQTSSKHCGSCGKVCASGTKCLKGKCELDCLKTETICGTTTKSCVDLQTDDKNCGKCGDACPTGQFCSQGKCECPTGYTYCNNKCVDTQFAGDHCGSCGNACQKGAVCNQGKCQICSSSTGKVCGSNCCPTAFDCCGSTTKSCVDIRISNQHCGKCGNACPARHLCCGSSCVKALSDTNNCGACGRKCASGESCCNGQCVDFKKDKLNCGACGKRCGAGQVCCNGTCADLRSSTSHCGTCGTVCGAGKSCCNGRCVDYKNDRLNCGLCGKSCASGESCCNGTCQNLSTSTLHCKSCGNACSLNGQPGILGCCSGACTNVYSSKSNCGRCGNQCSSNSTCCAGSCADLKNNVNNCGTCGKQCLSNERCCNGGCSDINVDAKNCGTCGKSCATGESCCSRSCKDLKKDTQNCGKCGVRCAAGETCCNGVCSNPQTDPNNCGACGKKCPTGNRCHLGQCVKCQPSARELCGNRIDDNCDGNVDEGCESVGGSTSVFDFQRFNNGNMFVTHYTSTKTLTASCIAADGKIFASRFTVASGAVRVLYPAVHTARKSQISVVVWLQQETSSSTSYRHYFRMYDQNCKATTPPIPVALGQSGQVDSEVAIDQDGNFVVAAKDAKQHLYLMFYSSAGKLQRSPLLVNNDLNKCSSSYGTSVAMNATGAGVVTCQSSSSRPIFFQRFANRALVGSLTEVDGSSRASSYTRSHTVGINDRGEFAIQWQNNNTARLDLAIIYSASGAKVKSLTLGTPLGGAYNGFSWVHQKVGILQNDFIFRSTSTSDNFETTLYRYTSTGKLIATSKSKSYGRYLYRVHSPAPGCSGSQCKHVICAVPNLRRNQVECGNFDLKPGVGLCNGSPCLCQPFEGESCYDGGSFARTPCKSGTRYCNADGLSKSGCVGQIAPAAETCGNRKDDDCDGGIDESCSTNNEFDTIGIVEALDAFSSGGLVTASWTGVMLRGSCFNPDTSVKVGGFRINEDPTRSVGLVSVRVSQVSNKFVVSWMESPSGSGNDYIFRSRLFDGNCKAISGVITHAKGSTTFGRMEVSIDDNGNFAVVLRQSVDGFNIRLYLYDSSGRLKKGNILPDPNASQCRKRFNHGTRVALNPKTGDGVVTCQSSSSFPIYYRRFKADGTFLEPEMVMVKDTDKGQSNSSEGHLLGVNRKGEFVIEYLDNLAGEFTAQFYNASGQVAKSVRLDSNFYNTNDVFGQSHQVKLIGDDFVLFTGDRYSYFLYPGRWYRFRSDGTLLASANASNIEYLRDYFTFGGSNNFILKRNRRTIARNAISLALGQGLCSGKACVCKPGATRDCYSGSNSSGTPRTPCKRGKQTCASNGLSWGSCIGEVIPKAEVCGDKIDNNCDGRTDENCPVTNFIESPYRSFNDYDVADSGKLVSVYWNSIALIGSCYNANLSVLKGSFLITGVGTTANKTINNPVVRISQNGNFILLMWRGAKSTTNGLYQYQFRLYDGNCNPLTSVILASQPQIYSRFDVAIANNGSFALVYWYSSTNQTIKRVKFRFYDNKGRLVGGEQDLDPLRKCNRENYGVHIAMNPVNGNGIATCQNSLSDAIYYRMFSNTGKLSGTDMVAVANTVPSPTNREPSSFSDSHAVGMNSKGEFVITWTKYRTREHLANFYNSSGTLVKHLSRVGNLLRSVSTTTNAFSYPHDSVLLAGNDFILRDGGNGNSPLTWYRFRSNGTLVSKAVNTSQNYRRYSGRFGNNSFYVHDHVRIYKNVVPLK